MDYRSQEGRDSQARRRWHIQVGLFDERNLFEVAHPDLPGGRLVACRNPQLALLRAHTRQSLLDATSRALEKVRGLIARGTIKGKDAIGVRIGRVVDQYKMSKHLVLDIRDSGFDFHLDEDKVAAEAAPDGIYVIRTSVPAQRLPTDDVVCSHKVLSEVERAFRSLKTIRSQGPIHPTPARGSGQGPHLPVHAGARRGVAHDGIVAGAALLR